ncbi:MAG: YHS domain-containing protein [Acidobacteriota bacterium]|jgi:YHS domain-containing protein
MRKVFVLLLIATFVAGAALAHGGKSHLLLGTVKELHQDHLVVKATDGHETTVMLTKSTVYEKDKKPATRAALVAGARVSLQLTEDNKSAVKVKIGGVNVASVDPVCGMKVDDPKTAPTSVHAGKTYYFCSKADKAKFDKAPGAYLKKG